MCHGEARVHADAKSRAACALQVAWQTSSRACDTLPPTKQAEHQCIDRAGTARGCIVTEQLKPSPLPLPQGRCPAGGQSGLAGRTRQSSNPALPLRLLPLQWQLSAPIPTVAAAAVAAAWLPLRRSLAGLAGWAAAASAAPLRHRIAPAVKSKAVRLSVRGRSAGKADLAHTPSRPADWEVEAAAAARKTLQCKPRPVATLHLAAHLQAACNLFIRLGGLQRRQGR